MIIFPRKFSVRKINVQKTKLIYPQRLLYLTRGTGFSKRKFWSEKSPTIFLKYYFTFWNCFKNIICLIYCTEQFPTQICFVRCSNILSSTSFTNIFYKYFCRPIQNTFNVYTITITFDKYFFKIIN